MRFVLSLQRFRVRVVDEESSFVSAHALHQKRRAVPGGDEHPDLRDGALRSDLPKAYVSEVVYGHRLLVSVNISVPVDPAQVPEQLDSVGQLLLRVISRDVEASAGGALVSQVVCAMQWSWWHAAVPIAPWGLPRPLSQSRDALHALEGNKLLQQRSCQWPGRHRLCCTCYLVGRPGSSQVCLGW